jgi:hypothetical protein
MFDGRVYVNTQVCCYLGVGLGGLDAVCEIVVDFFGILSIKAGLFLYEQAGGILQVGIAAGTDNQGRETAEFIGSIIGGFLATIAVVAIPIPGIRILAGSTGSYYGGEYAEAGALPMASLIAEYIAAFTPLVISII